MYHEKSGQVYRAAVIGYGKIGQLRAQLVEQHQALKIDSICELNQSVIPEGTDYPCFNDYRSVIDRRPDIIFVCTSNDKLAEVTIAALDAGCNVFSEKPPGRTVAETQAIIDAETRNPGLKLKFGFNHRYHESVVHAKRLVDANRFGKILSVRGVYGKSGAVDYETQWRNRREIAGGGILLDQGIHMLDLMLLFCGSFEDSLVWKPHSGTSKWRTTPSLCFATADDRWAC